MSRDVRWEAYLREWNPIEARIRALDAALWRRATALSGLGAGRNVWHNAMLAAADGQAWREVNYTRLRHALWIEDVDRGRLRVIERTLRRAVYARHYPERLPLGPFARAA